MLNKPFESLQFLLWFQWQAPFCCFWFMGKCQVVYEKVLIVLFFYMERLDWWFFLGILWISGNLIIRNLFLEFNICVGSHLIAQANIKHQETNFEQSNSQKSIEFPEIHQIPQKNINLRTRVIELGDFFFGFLGIWIPETCFWSLYILFLSKSSQKV